MGSGPTAIPGQRAERLRMLLDALPVMDLASIWGIVRVLEAEDGVVLPAGAVGDLLHARWHNNCPTGLARMGEQLLVEPDRTEALRVTGVPTMVLFGEADDAWPPAVQESMAHELGAPVVRIGKAAHSPAAERPAETAAALLTWWDVLVRTPR
jgi:pimeloyl-ACP methyl ester carboxylesterase